jgi:hypothetical protein
MPINSKFLAARIAEHQHRLQTHLGLAEPMLLPLAGNGRTAFTVPQALITERMRLELTLAGNAFLCGGEPGHGDLFVYLWRLHPEFCRPLPHRVPALRRWGHAPGRFLLNWYAYGRLRPARLQAWLVRQCRRADLPAAAALVAARLALADQDAPGADLETTRRSLVAPPFCYFDDLVDYVSRTYHVPPGAVLDLPRALVHQLYRNRLLSAPDGELSVFAPSDALL